MTEKERSAIIKLTKKEINQLKEYTRFDATRINKAIRLDKINHSIQEKIDVIDSAFNKAQPLEF